MMLALKTLGPYRRRARVGLFVAGNTQDRRPVTNSCHPSRHRVNAIATGGSTHE